MAMKKGDDPADFTVDEVNEYLAKAKSEEEVERIYAAEEEGKARVGILSNRSDGPEIPPDGPVDDETPEDVPEDAEAPSEAADDEVQGYWTTDALGNPKEAARPARAFVTGTEFYPFEYEDSPNPAEVIATEDVYSVINYIGSDRRGSTLAYNKGSRVPRAALNRITDDMTGRHGPVKSEAEPAQ